MEKYNLEEIKNIIKETHTLDDVELRFFDIACQETITENPDILSKKLIDRETVAHEYNGTGNIDELINILQNFKKQNFYKIIPHFICDYDCIYLLVKKENITEQEVAEELFTKMKNKLIHKVYCHKQTLEKQKRIKALKEELYKLENE